LATRRLGAGVAEADQGAQSGNGAPRHAPNEMAPGLPGRHRFHDLVEPTIVHP
jgi:hypothetical protein